MSLVPHVGRLCEELLIVVVMELMVIYGDIYIYNMLSMCQTRELA